MSALWIVTGASRGIGAAIARELAGPDRTLLLTATAAPNLEAIIAELKGQGSEAVPLALDLARPDAAATLATVLEGQEVAGLVNNAGILERGKLESLTDAQIDRAIAVNLTGLMRVTREALRHMKPGGRIINVGSISGTLGTPEGSLYNATKWALTGLTKSWAEELKEREIFVAEVRPGGVDTDMIKQTPFQPAMEAGEVARLVRFLATEAPWAMTGSAVDIFG